MMKEFEQLDFTDSFIFYKVMSMNPEITKRVVELILETKIEKMIINEGEKTIRVASGAKGVRLDIYVETSDGRRIDLEMQTINYDYLPRRMRYYQSIADVNELQKGETYKKLPENIVIFIVLKDPYKKGFYRYTFENRCAEDKSLLLGDGTKKIFLNAGGDITDASEEMQWFLRYIRKEAAMSELTKEIDKAVTDVKKDYAIRLEYMSMNARETDIRDEAEKKGIEIGEKRGIEIGEKRGIEKGEMRGIKKGEQKMLKKVRELADEGMTIDKIISALQAPKETGE